MKLPLFPEHSLPSQVFLAGQWWPAWTYVRFDNLSKGVLRIESEQEEGMRVWKSTDCDDFASDLVDLLYRESTPNHGPLWRTDVSLNIRQGDTRNLTTASLEIGSKEFAPGVIDSYCTLSLAGESEPYVGNDLESLVSQIKGVECCGICHYGRYCPFGGNDFVFGLYCFRDAPEIVEDRESFMSHAEKMDEVAFPFTPVLHLCPSFRRWEPWKE